MLTSRMLFYAINLSLAGLKGIPYTAK